VCGNCGAPGHNRRTCSWPARGERISLPEALDRQLDVPATPMRKVELVDVAAQAVPLRPRRELLEERASIVVRHPKPRRVVDGAKVVVGRRVAPVVDDSPLPCVPADLSAIGARSFDVGGGARWSLFPRREATPMQRVRRARALRPNVCTPTRGASRVRSYKVGNDFSADLKRQAHAVRQVVDNLPITSDPNTGEVIHPRRRRQTQPEGGRRHDPHISRTLRVALSRAR
jgi:hypothetical protein